MKLPYNAISDSSEGENLKNIDKQHQTFNEVSSMSVPNTQDFSEIETLIAKSKTIILYELITGTASSHLLAHYAEFLSLNADSYKVLICENFNNEQATTLPFLELLKIVEKDETNWEHIKIDNREVILAKGSRFINKLSHSLRNLKNRPLQEGSILYYLFLTYGRQVYSLNDIHLSYEDSAELLKYRFFCTHEQHVLEYRELKKISSRPPHESFLQPDEKLLDYFVNTFIGYTESFNRKMISFTMSKLEALFLQSNYDIMYIKLFFIDLYLQVHEKINNSYSNSEIPFKSNSFIIDYIYNRNFLYEITDFLSAQFEMIIASIRSPSSDIIMDDVLFYINHNYTGNIKLESIAKLFGYNNAYLGKIFHKTVGQSFNSYVDQKRIEYSKHLILENRLKIYEIAKEVGYKNVDYFHKKFKKYVGKSPSEYKKQMNN